MEYRRDLRMDTAFATLPEWQQAVCQQVQDLVHGVDPEVEETIKRSDRPYFVLQGNVCALLPTKDHVNVFPLRRRDRPDPDRIITGGHDNSTAGLWPSMRGSQFRPSRWQQC